MWKVIAIFGAFLILTGAREILWTYIIKDVSANSTCENLVFNARVQRINRTMSGISGEIEIRSIITDDYYGSISGEYSRTGVGEFQPIPYAVSRQSINEFMNTTYKNVVMDSLSECSNLPVFTGNWMGFPNPAKYWLNKCFLMTDNLPTYMRPGFYKIHAQAQGPSGKSYLSFLVEVALKSK